MQRGSTEGPAVVNTIPNISVCVCTYKRPELLKHLLEELAGQETAGRFTYSIVVADNDAVESARPLVANFSAAAAVPIQYCVEPQQSISLVRNKALKHARGNFIAFIDDDEFPTQRWLLTLFEASQKYGVDGVLGPVLPHFDKAAPEWVIRGGFYHRPTYPTGFVISWNQGRTGNVLLKKRVIEAEEQPFDPAFHRASDQDFFRRMIDKGFVFVWCNEAVAYEVVPPSRWRRAFMIKRALLRGRNSLQHPTVRSRSIVKSFIAVPAYAVALPFSLVLGQRWFMPCLIKFFDHLGKVLTVMGINPIKSPFAVD